MKESSESSSNETSSSDDESPRYPERDDLITEEEVKAKRQAKIIEMGLGVFPVFNKDTLQPEVKAITDRFRKKDRSDLSLGEWRKDQYYRRDGFLDEWI